jgi:DnaK suppressor protein
MATAVGLRTDRTTGARLPHAVRPALLARFPVAALHRRLEELRLRHRRELDARMRELREPSVRMDTVDGKDVEALTDNSLSTDLGAVLAQMSAQTLQEIESALRRLARGTYGRCADCRAEMSPARLRAMPFAERCRDCQEQLDAVAAPA